MARADLPRPTDAEISILQVLWEHQPCTVRRVWEELSRVHKTGYNTVLKLMQIMTTKGLVVRDESNKAHLYATTREREQTQNQLVQDLMSRAFEGSGAALAIRALSEKRASPEEVEEIRRLLDEMGDG
jgi:BlaI family transcriptional regulator, penicillinase repressor